MLNFFRQKNHKRVEATLHTFLDPKSLYELKHLVCVTAENYQQLYIDLLQRLAEYQQQHQGTQGEFAARLTLAITVLKHRRAYMLPAGSNAETCYQQQDAWTYALFTAALFKDDTQEPAFDLAKSLLSTPGMQWLQRHESLYKIWEDFLNNITEPNNVIASIIQKAKAALAGETITAAIVDPRLYSASPGSNLAVDEAEKDSATNANPMEADIAAPTAEELDKNPSLILVNQFIAWIKKELAQEKLVVNQMEDLDPGFIHHVPEGILLVMPELWDRFLEMDTQLNKTDKARLISTKNRWVQVAKAHGDYFLLDEHKNIIHRYCIGEWKNRQIAEGILLKPAYLFNTNALPPINDELTPDPVNNLQE